MRGLYRRIRHALIPYKTKLTDEELSHFAGDIKDKEVFRRILEKCFLCAWIGKYNQAHLITKDFRLFRLPHNQAMFRNEWGNQLCWGDSVDGFNQYSYESAEDIYLHLPSFLKAQAPKTVWPWESWF